MPYYLSTFTGAGTREDPKVPLGATGTWAVVDLSPAGQGEGRCLLYTDTALTLSGLLASVVFLANSPDDAIPNGVRTAINNRLGTSIPTGMSFRTLVRRLLTTETGAGRWGRILADGGVFQVSLGALADTWDAS
jgi:hypothetical protein